MKGTEITEIQDSILFCSRLHNGSLRQGEPLLSGGCSPRFVLSLYLQPALDTGSDEWHYTIREGLKDYFATPVNELQQMVQGDRVRMDAMKERLLTELQEYGKAAVRFLILEQFLLYKTREYALPTGSKFCAIPKVKIDGSQGKPRNEDASDELFFRQVMQELKQYVVVHPRKELDDILDENYYAATKTKKYDYTFRASIIKKGETAGLLARNRGDEIISMTELLGRVRNMDIATLQASLFLERADVLQKEANLMLSARCFGRLYREHLFMLSTLVMKLYPKQGIAPVKKVFWMISTTHEDGKSVACYVKDTLLFHAEILVSSRCEPSGKTVWDVMTTIGRQKIDGKNLPLFGGVIAQKETQTFPTAAEKERFVNGKMAEMDKGLFRNEAESIVPVKYEGMFMPFGYKLPCYKYESDMQGEEE